MDATVILWVAAIVVAAGIAWMLAARGVRERYRRAMEALARSIREGEKVGSGAESLPGVSVLSRAVTEALGGESATGRESGGAPSEPARSPAAPAEGDVDEDFVTSSLSGIADYLKEGVEAPLRESLESDSPLRGGVEDALIAMQDLYFYLREVPEARTVEDLNALAREAVDEFGEEWDVDVGLKIPERPTMVEVNREALLDAIYLVLHNAGSFGGGKPVDVVVRYQDGDCWLVVRDEGEGFDGDALERAFEPFYTTSRLGLGLGLYHVKKVVQALDGTVAVRNRRKGGGQVEIVLPEAEDDEE